MPNPTAPAPAAAPAAATPPPAPVPASPAPAAAPAAPKVNEKVGSTKVEGTPANRLFQRLSNNAPEAKDEPMFPGDKPAKSETPKTETPVPAPAAPVEKPIKVAKKTPKRPELPVAKETAPPAPAAPVTPPAPAANWEDSLLDEERTALEDAKFAEETFPEHKGLSEKMTRFFREHQKFLEKNPDPEDDDPEYKKVLALQPQLSATEKRKILEARISSSVKKGYEPEIQDLRHELFVRDEEPRVRTEAAQLFDDAFLEKALPADIVKTFKEKGVAEMNKQYADELEVASSIVTAARSDAEELLRITRTNPKTGRPLAKIATDPSDPKWEQHDRLGRLVESVCEDFKNTASEKEQVRNGKWFVTREEWAAGYKNHPDKYWTFTNSPEHIREVVQRAANWIPGVIDRTIKERQEALERRGYRRFRETTPAAPSAPPAPVSAPTSPRPSLSPSPSAPNAAPISPGTALARKLQAGG